MKKVDPHILADCGVIAVRGARQNNLRGIDLDVPLGKLNVITGPSGSGKSSLAFDTIYAEGQRRYVETFSPYTRQFLERMDKPRVDSISGIPPAIAIEQANPVKSTRSTVGTMTEINDYLKCLMARMAAAFCPSCGRAIRCETVQSIVDQLFSTHRGEPLLVTFSVPAPSDTSPKEFFAFLQQQGYLRIWLDGALCRTDSAPQLTRLPPLVRVVQDRVKVEEANRSRLCDALETALRFGKGAVTCLVGGRTTDFEEIPFSAGWHCAHCDLQIAPPTPALFSFNHPLGACPRCRGFGRTIGIDYERAVPDRTRSLEAGAIKAFQGENGRECQRDLLRCARRCEVDIGAPFEELPKSDQDWVIYGDDPKAPAAELWENERWYGVRGFFEWLESKAYKMHIRVLLSRYRSYTQCPDCRGGRYQPATLNFRLGGYRLPEIMALPIDQLLALIAALPPPGDDTAAETVRREIEARLRYLVEVGLDYLTLDRSTRGLSGGEIERVNLTTCLGASLVNTLFVLDEPSVGLHPRDTGRLIRVMQNLRDKGNTLVVVEHEEAVIRAADHLIELGPGRGAAGGTLVYNGAFPAALKGGGTSSVASNGRLIDDASTEQRGGTAIKSPPRSLTFDYLSGRRQIAVPKRRREPRHFLTVREAAEHNLCKIDVQVPLGVFACVTGVSGSGKSTLVHDVLFRNLQLAKGIAPEEAPGLCKSLLGVEQVDQVVMVDQSPLARTPRSSPALYLGVFDAIRELFAMTADARARGLSASAFSFNSGTGRCERCCGNGFEKIEMQFLSDVFVRCPECEGKRYQPHVLTIQLHGKSIHDVLQMTVQDAVAFFAEIGASRVTERLRVLEEVGLGYLTLGQPLNVLSGGESQRLKLVERLTSRGEKNALLILDEPTTGLHFDDIAQLLRVFDRLVEQGNSLLVIEHNLDVIKCADYVIDLGPEAGSRGGRVVATGTPEKIAGDRESHTGRYLARHLRGGEARGESSEIEDDRGLARVAEDAPSPHRAASAALLADHVDSNGRNCIVVRGAREHNLQNIDLFIPRDEMVIITGPSGSGKSTLAFDILFAEGQRRFLDSMSVYARQFVQQLEKPDVDSISGLPPSVAIEQRITRGGGKSTVATVTEVYHFLRLLFAKLGVQHCPRCDLPVERQSVEAMARRCEALARKGRIRVLAPLVKARKGFHTDVARWAVRNGFDHLLVDGRLVAATAFPKLERFREHSIDVVVGERGSPARVRELLKRSLEIGKGTAHVLDAAGALHVLSLEMSCPGCGQSFEPLDPRIFSFNSPHGWCPDCRGFGEIWHGSENPRLESALEIEMDEERQHEWLDEGESEPCTSCGGSRLNPVARHVRLNGTRMEDVAGMAAQRALEWIGKLRFRGAQQVIAADILPEVAQRLHFMADVGLDYLALNRGAKTLSGGESQRIRLAAQLGSNLRGVLYVLDEPTIGLHPRDNVRLLDTLAALKANGNSLIIVEHDEETMRRADTIIDLGPAAGRGGGRVVAQGSIEAVCREEHSATGRCLREPLNHPTRGSRRPLDSNVSWLALEGATIHNLKQCDVQFPIGRFTAITGISGSGKSSLMRGTLKPLIEEHLRRPRKERVPKRERAGARREAGASKTKMADAPSLSVRPAQMVPPLASKNAGGTSAAAAPRIIDFVEAIYEVDQSPIGKTSRSTPATYIKVFDEIRKLFAQVPLARIRGYSASRFSFNTEGGRCETCAGQGVVKVEMAFLPTSYIPCEQCRGKRYNAATLEVLWNEKSIGDVMEMPVAVAANLFRAVPKVHRSLQLLCETGLGYLTLGQPSPTLSGGEAQRLKLVTELTRGTARASHAILRQQRRAKSIVYLLEEPTIGLHMADVEELLKVLHRLVDEGHTVVVIEHNLSLIADADYVVDIGPEAGEQGGEVVATGTPEAVAKSKRSRTAPFLREILRLEQPPRSAKKKACTQLV